MKIYKTQDNKGTTGNKKGQKGNKKEFAWRNIKFTQLHIQTLSEDHPGYDN